MLEAVLWIVDSVARWKFPFLYNVIFNIGFPMEGRLHDEHQKV